MARCLFIAPLKPPDHPVPSGDRTIARLMMRLLARLGYDVELASHLITRIRDPDPAAFAATEAAARAELARLVDTERHSANPSAMVFCYHLYYRAPDLIGPRLAAELGVPYIVAEASRAPKRALGPFAPWHAHAEAACHAARLVLVPSAHDRVMLERLKPPSQWLADLKPFIDPADWPATSDTATKSSAALDHAAPAELLCVGMMRPDRKLDSYRLLAAALARIEARAWRLTIVGDGPARAAVEALFAPFGSRVRFTGRIDDPAALGLRYRSADLFVWPAIGEPLGMVFLEAAAHGLPSLAGAGRSVADVVSQNVSGEIVPEGDVMAFAHALASLIDEPARRRALGASARRFALGERSIAQAEPVLRGALAAIGVGGASR